MKLRFDGVRLALPHFELRLDLEIASPRVALFGQSGAGKTSALELMTGIRRPDGGRITADERVLHDTESGVCVPPAARAIGYVPQDDAVFPHLSVRANVTYGLKDGADHAIVDRLVDAFGIRPMLRARAGKLSGGEKRRVSIARALATSPSIVLLDEPFAGLDAALKARLVEFLRDHQRATGISMIVVTHDRAEALALADEVVVLERGEVVAQGAGVDVLS